MSELKNQIRKYWNQQLNQFHKLSKSGEAIGVVGIYGVGKFLFIEHLIKNEVDGLVVEITIKDHKPQNSKEAYSLIIKEFKRKKILSEDAILPNNDFEFHYLIKKAINDYRENNINKKIVLVFDESQHFLKFPESFWDNFTSLQYYQKKELQLIFVGQPGLSHHSTAASQRLLQNNFIYIPPFNKLLIKLIIELETGTISAKCEQFLWKFSHGHYGTAKYLLRKINQFTINNKITSHTFSKKFFQSIIMDDPLLTIWIKEIWSQLSSEQQFIISEYLENKIIQPKHLRLDAFLGLVKLGVFSIKKNAPIFFLEGFESMIRNITKKESIENKKVLISGNKILVDSVDVSSIFTKYEQNALNCLLTESGKYISYEKLGIAIWKDKLDERYSLWALSKLISRLRKKISKLGLSPKTIKTVRSRGYGWYKIEQ